MTQEEYCFVSKLKSAYELIESALDCEEFKKLDETTQKVLEHFNARLLNIVLTLCLDIPGETR